MSPPAHSHFPAIRASARARHGILQCQAIACPTIGSRAYNTGAGGIGHLNDRFKIPKQTSDFAAVRTRARALVMRTDEWPAITYPTRAAAPVRKARLPNAAPTRTAVAKPRWSSTRPKTQAGKSKIDRAAIALATLAFSARRQRSGHELMALATVLDPMSRGSDRLARAGTTQRPL